jgi:hypothetical protein
MAWCLVKQRDNLPHLLRVIGGRWRRFLILALHRILFRAINSRKMWWAVHVAQIGEKRNVFKFSVGKLEERVGRPRSRWKDYFNSDV